MMKPVSKLLGLTLLLGTSLNAAAWGGNNGWDWNPWPVWTPMYWMEEMVGDNGWNDGPYNGYYPYGSGYSPYGAYPYGGYPYGGYPYGSYGAPYLDTPAWGYNPYSYSSPWR